MVYRHLWHRQNGQHVVLKLPPRTDNSLWGDIRGRVSARPSTVDEDFRRSMEEPLAPLLHTGSDHDTEDMEVHALVCSAEGALDMSPKSA